MDLQLAGKRVLITGASKGIGLACAVAFAREGADPILVARDAQKAIVLGAGGERIKRIATESRLDLERMLGCRVYLELFVKVRSGWSDTEQSLRAYGYE